MRKADKDNDNRMNLKEIKHFLKQINIQVDDHYAAEIFKVSKNYIWHIILYYIEHLEDTAVLFIEYCTKVLCS